MVDEQWLLDFERKNFMELLATDKTKARIEFIVHHKVKTTGFSRSALALLI